MLHGNGNRRKSVGYVKTKIEIENPKNPNFPQVLVKNMVNRGEAGKEENNLCLLISLLV